MATFSVNAYGKTLQQIEESWRWVTQNQKKNGKLELWEIEPTKPFNNRYVIITRRPGLGRDAEIMFLKKIKEA
jgi:hypothetical protein